MQVVLFTRNKKSLGVQERPNGSCASCGAWVPKIETPTLIYLAKTKLPFGIAFYLRALESSTMNLDLRLDKNDI